MLGETRLLCLLHFTWDLSIQSCGSRALSFIFLGISHKQGEHVRTCCTLYSRQRSLQRETLLCNSLSRFLFINIIIEICDTHHVHELRSMSFSVLLSSVIITMSFSVLLSSEYYSCRHVYPVSMKSGSTSEQDHFPVALTQASISQTAQNAYLR